MFANRMDQQTLGRWGIPHEMRKNDGENHPFFMGKSTISTGNVQSFFFNVYQRVMRCNE